MNINEIKISYKAHDIFNVTLSIYKDALSNEGVDKSALNTKQKLFSFYEEKISNLLDDAKDSVSTEREDFYETVSIMSWAIYQDWSRCVVDKKSKIDDFDCIDMNKVIDSFMDNLNCEEGMDLYKKVIESK